jgi:hypothetical protein
MDENPATLQRDSFLNELLTSRRINMNCHKGNAQCLRDSVVKINHGGTETRRNIDFEGRFILEGSLAFKIL